MHCVWLRHRYAYGAADAARIINDAKLYYLQDMNSKNQAAFSKTVFLKALKDVSILSQNDNFTLV